MTTHVIRIIINFNLKIFVETSSKGKKRIKTKKIERKKIASQRARRH